MESLTYGNFWRLLFQDDHGNVYSVAKFDTKEKAEAYKVFLENNSWTESFRHFLPSMAAHTMKLCEN